MRRRRGTVVTGAPAGLRRAGVSVTALPGGKLNASPTLRFDRFSALTPGGRREVWFRVAVNLLDMDGQMLTATSPRPGVLAGLHAHCLRQAGRVAITGAGATVRRWRARADVAAAVRAGQSPGILERDELLEHRERQAAVLARRGRVQEAGKWSARAEALAAMLAGRMHQ
jgi:hypothetical protein